MSDQYDPAGAALADRHYSRTRPGSRQFVPPGRMLVLITEQADALWVSSWPYPSMLRRSWAQTAWMCTLFRNESAAHASELITEAVAATRWFWGEPPADGMVSIIDQRKVQPIKIRGKDTYGFTYRKAGFQDYGLTERAGLLIVQLLPDAMPAPCMPLGPRAKQIELSRHVSNLALFAEAK